MFSTATILASLLTLTQARISGFSSPATVAPDTQVKFRILTEEPASGIHDEVMAFGIASVYDAQPRELGRYLRSKILGADNSNTLDPISHYVHIPATTPPGDYVISATLFSLVGDARALDLQGFTCNVTVGPTTGQEQYVGSQYVGDYFQGTAKL